MAIAELAGGTQTAVINTEHELVTDTTGHTAVLVVDTVNMVDGDTLRLRLYAKVRAGGTERLAYEAWFAHIQDEILKYCIPIPANISIRATLMQDDGVGRDFVWALLSLDS